MSDQEKYKDVYSAEICFVIDRLLSLGLTIDELDNFISLSPTEIDFYQAVLIVIRQDRRGVFAHQKRLRAAAKKKRMLLPKNRIENSTRARIWAAVKGSKNGKLMSRLGYSASDLVNHLESLFVDGMSWDNYGEWHIDHKKPCSLFDQSDEKQFIECWSLSNLQPLWASDNIKKGAKYVSP